MDIIRARHSVRQYTDQKIEPNKREILDSLIAKSNAESGLNIQIFYDEPECFEGGLAHYGKFAGVTNYIALVGKKEQSTEAGYYGEKIVLKAQEIGLNTCWVALTHGKSKAVLQQGEKEICLIAIGYGANHGATHKSKSVDKVSNMAADAPEWFKTGVEAALLAPTAINQQKFYFSIDGDTVTLKVKGIGTLTKLDLGIVKYHFEYASGHDVVVK